MASVPIYYMSLFPIPRLVRVRIKRIRMYFLCGGGDLEGRPHLVKWKVFCLDMKIKGLGIQNLSTFSKTLLCKWSWHFMK